MSLAFHTALVRQGFGRHYGRLYGLCYQASTVLYWRLISYGYEPQVMQGLYAHEGTGVTHRWVEVGKWRLDPTRRQFDGFSEVSMNDPSYLSQKGVRPGLYPIQGPIAELTKRSHHHPTAALERLAK